MKIRKQQELRETFKTLTAHWNELDRIHQKEFLKKKVRLHLGGTRGFCFSLHVFLEGEALKLTAAPLSHARAANVQSKLAQSELLSRGDIKDNLKEHIDGLKEEFLSAYSGSRWARVDERRREHCKHVIFWKKKSC